MAELKKIAFVLDEFKLDSPAQHLLDRFLAGFHRDGKWTRPEDRLVAVSIPDEEWNAELDHRVKDFDLRRTKSLLEALQDADGVVVVGTVVGGVVVGGAVAVGGTGVVAPAGKQIDVPG